MNLYSRPRLPRASHGWTRSAFQNSIWMSCFSVAVAFLMLAPISTFAGSELILVRGAAGARDYEKRFDSMSQEWIQAATSAGLKVNLVGFSHSNSYSHSETENALAGPDQIKPEPQNSPDSELSHREQFQKAISSVSSEGNDPLWIVYVGHGSFDGRLARLNLQGPDVSDQDLASWLQQVNRPMIIIIGSASSAPFMKTLAGPDRTVITATRSSSEESYTYFGEYLCRSFENPKADLDLDQAVSVLEAFIFASRSVVDFYQQSQRMVTEHAALDDSGDGVGAQADQFIGLEPKSDLKDGFKSRGRYLIPPDSDLGLSPEWLEERLVLEQKLISLRKLKDSIDPQDYQQRLESVLLELARGYAKASGQ